MSQALRDAGESVEETNRYRGKAEILLLFGVGAAVHAEARDRHLKAGGRALLFDLGYVGRKKITGYFKGSLNHEHPQALLDQAPDDGSRWEAHDIGLRNAGNPEGPIILVGMGHKSRNYVGSQWEATKFRELKSRFPDREIVYRPKKVDDPLKLPCLRDGASPIAYLISDASLVVCRHSNVSVDAVIAGVPFEAEDGAAMWLKGKDYTKSNRLEFLRRLAWFQWKPTEAAQAWMFYKGLV